MVEPLRRDYLSDEEYYLACIAELEDRVKELEEDLANAEAYEEVLRERILEYNPLHWMEE
jgi:hypothetical protein